MIERGIQTVDGFRELPTSEYYIVHATFSENNVLSIMEQNLMRVVVNGLSEDEVSEVLVVSPKTVAMTKKNISKKVRKLNGGTRPDSFIESICILSNKGMLELSLEYDTVFEPRVSLTTEGYQVLNELANGTTRENVAQKLKMDVEHVEHQERYTTLKFRKAGIDLPSDRLKKLLILATQGYINLPFIKRRIPHNVMAGGTIEIDETKKAKVFVL